MNSINITGRLVSDPELRPLPSGGSVCKLRLAVEGLAPKNETGYISASASAQAAKPQRGCSPGAGSWP